MSKSDAAGSRGTDFIREMIEGDLRSGKYDGRVVTRFPPEPNGYLHIGHAKSICLNFGVAGEYGGHCNLRYDDTNPSTEDPEYVEAIQRDIHWLGYDWGDALYFASDYFERLYGYAVELIENGVAYVDSLSEAEIRQYRGTVTEPGRESPYRDRSVEESLDLFRRMRDGEFADGEHVLRARIDMSAANMKMRDPLLYRIRHAHHYRRGDDWCIYPMYDFAHCLSDSIEAVTHSLCTLEFENNRPVYDWVLEHTSAPRPLPEQTEFARLKLSYTVVSKRKLLELVDGGYVDGWDDPRMPTLTGLERRGYTPRSIRSFCDSIGVAKANSVVDVAQLEHAVRDDLNHRAPRLLAVLDPLPVVITNYESDEAELLEAPYFPADIAREGSRRIPFSRRLLIERADFAEDPPAGYKRMAPGREIRLRYGYIVRCDEVVKDPDSGAVVEVRCTYDPETRGGSAAKGRKISGTIHWVSADHSVPIEARLYDRLFDDPQPDRGKSGADFRTFLNPDSLEARTEARIEPAIDEFGPGSHLQFERQGYFYWDPASSEDRPVFNRTVGLRDTWAKRANAPTRADPTPPQPTTAAPAAPSGRPSAGTERLSSDRERAIAASLSNDHGLKADDAERLARDDTARTFFEAALTHSENAPGLATWILNEVRGEHLRAGERDGETRLSPQHLAELVALVDAGRISGKIGKAVLADVIDSGRPPAAIVEERGLGQISDVDTLTAVIAEVLASNEAQVTEYRAGKSALKGFFVGQIMRATRGQANPELIQRLLAEQLDA